MLRSFILLLLMLSFYLWTGLVVPAYEKTCSLKKEYECPRKLWYFAFDTFSKVHITQPQNCQCCHFSDILSVAQVWMKQARLKCATCRTSSIFSGMVVICNQQNTLFLTISCFGATDLTDHFKNEWSVCHCYYNPQCTVSVHRPAIQAGSVFKPSKRSYIHWWL